MKFLLTFILFVSLINGQPEKITNFDQLMTTLENGYNTNVVIYYAKTKLVVDGEETEAPNAVGGMGINTFEYFAKGTVRNEKAFLSTSETVLINHPFYGMVNNYVKLRIYEDNKIEITAQYIDTLTLEIKMDEKFVSEINNNQNDSGVMLFKN